MTMQRLLVFVLLTAAAAATAMANDSLTAGTVLPARWTYSVDGGKTWKAEAPKITGSNAQYGHREDVAKAEFTIADPAKIGILKIATKDPRGAFALTEANSVNRYNVGSCPNLLQTKIILNGKATDLGYDPNTLYRYLAILPAELKTGANTLELAGCFWHKNYGAGAVSGELRLEVIPTNRAVLDRLPILGMIGDDYFGVACRAVVPSQFSVAVTPLEPAGAETKQAFGPTRLLKAKVRLPKGTRTFRYTVTVAAGGAAKSYGPYEARVPKGGVGFRFMAGGGTAIYKDSPEGLVSYLAKVREVHPDLFIHTGNYQNCTPWDFLWSDDFLRQAQPTFASIPMFATVNITEMVSPESFGHTFYFPPDDANRAQWTVAIGNVRFVALEAFSMSEDQTGAGAKWLEDVLNSAKEDYVLVFNAHAADCADRGRQIVPSGPGVCRRQDRPLARQVPRYRHHRQYVSRLLSPRAAPGPGRAHDPHRQGRRIYRSELQGRTDPQGAVQGQHHRRPLRAVRGQERLPGNEDRRTGRQAARCLHVQTAKVTCVFQGVSHVANIVECGRDSGRRRRRGGSQDEGLSHAGTGVAAENAALQGPGREPRRHAARCSNVIASNPFGPGPDSSGRSTIGTHVYQGHEWCGMIGARLFCIFDVKDDVMQMKVQTCGWPGGLLDKKTFKARGL